MKNLKKTLSIGLATASMAATGAAMAPSVNATPIPGSSTIDICYKSIGIGVKTTPHPCWTGQSYSDANHDLHVSIQNIQYRLLSGGLKVVPDGIYGPATKSAVIYVQKLYHLTPDGVVGPQTARAMGLSFGKGE